MNKETIHIGIIGIGEHIRRAHTPGLTAKEGVQFLRWFDPATAAQDIEPIFGTKSTFEEVIQDANISAILIGSPDAFHADQFLASIKAGKHVFIEKPLAIDSVGFKKIMEGLQIAKEKDLVVSSCHPRRFDPPVHAFKELFDNKEWLDEHIGTVTRFDFKFFYHQATDAWKQDRSLMLDHFGHEIDLLRYFLNKKDKKVSISAKKIRDGFAAYTVEGQIDDIEFVFDGMRILDEKKYQEYVEIRGTKGIASLYINGGIVILNSKTGQSMMNLPPKDYTDMFSVVNTNFVAAIRKEEKPYLEYYDFLVNNYSGILLLEKGEFSSERDLLEFLKMI